MDGALSIAESAINANQTEIAVTSENVANAQTPGYAEETANLAALPGGTAGIGSGVEVANISQAQNLMLQMNNLQAQGALSNLNSLQQVLSEIQNIFPIGQSSSSSSNSTTTNTGLAGQLANFWNAWDSVAQDPSGSAPRTEVINQAQGIATTLQESSTQLDQLSANGVTQLQDSVSQINSLLTEVGQLNSQILQTEGAAGNPDAIKDQLQGILGQLAQQAGVNVQYGSNNTATVTLGGVSLVQNANVANVTLVDTGGTYSLQANSPGPVSLGVSSGTVAGLLAGVNQYIPQYQNELNGVANSLITTVNNQLAAGYTASGAAGGPLFDGTGAANIGIVAAVAANPSLLAAASTTGAAAANDGSNAQTMAEFASSQTGADSQYQGLIQSIGSITENVNTQVSAQTAVANQAQSALQSATGVNLDAELTNLMNFQSNYQASAKLLTVIDATMQSLIQAVS